MVVVVVAVIRSRRGGRVGSYVVWLEIFHTSTITASERELVLEPTRIECQPAHVRRSWLGKRGR